MQSLLDDLTLSLEAEGSLPPDVVAAQSAVREGLALLREQLHSPDKARFNLGLSTTREFPGGKVDGALVEGPSPHWIVMFQQPNLYPWMSVAQNIGLGLKFAGRPKKQIAARVDELLQRFTAGCPKLPVHRQVCQHRQ